MLRIISLDTARCFLALVEMNADENAIARPICDRDAVLERNVTVPDTRHQRRQSLRLEETVHSLRDIKCQILFVGRSAHCARILAAMSGIKNDEREWRRSSRPLSRNRSRRRQKKLPPDERAEPQREAQPREQICDRPSKTEPIPRHCQPRTISRTSASVIVR